MVIFVVVSIVILGIMVFEGKIIKLWTKIFKSGK